jgi:hypothetical protein
MSRRPVRFLAAALLALPLLSASPAAAQGGQREILVLRAPSVTESAVSACAGGAAIGALIAWGTGIGAVGPSAGLFCGLSVAASLSASVASYTWRTITSFLP